MTEQEFREKLANAKEVSDWKRNILIGSSQPTSPVPRPPVHNSSLASQENKPKS